MAQQGIQGPGVRSEEIPLGGSESTHPSHTPGPWKLRAKVTGGSRYVVAGRSEIARVYFAGNPGRPTALANACLIAAAPDLAAALRRALNWLSSYPGDGAMSAYNEARAALAKAGVE
jgi:hypothetical protein